MKFHKQRDLIILNSKHFEFLIGPVFAKLWLVENLQCSHLIFAYIFCEFSALA